MKLPSHGSNPQQLYESLRITSPGQLSDFSVNINPLGPLKTLEENWHTMFDKVEDYPDPFGTELLHLISKKEAIPSSYIMLGNGGAELITLLANYFTNKQVGMIQPTFSEYESTSRAFGSDITYFYLDQEQWNLPLYKIKQKMASLDALYVCHPSNPLGITFTYKELKQLLQLAEKNHCYLIMDEAFIDFLKEDRSYISHVPNYTHLIILRSLTKMYSIAGLRLGYLVASPFLITQLKTIQPHWSVNAIALEAGKFCLQDTHRVKDTLIYVEQERTRMLNALKNLGYITSDSQVNFYVLRDAQLDNQLPLIHFLLQKGIVPRHTENFPGLDGRWLRLSIKKRKENDKLLEALKEWKQVK